MTKEGKGGTERAIERAMEGGYGKEVSYYPGECEISYEAALLDPIFWQALGNKNKWYGTKCYPCAGHHDMDDLWWDNGIGEGNPCWRHVWHRLIDHLAEGGTPDDYFNSILTQ